MGRYIAWVILAIALAGCIAQVTDAPKTITDKSPVAGDGACSFLTQTECEKDPKCKVSFWMCDYVPEGKTFEEVCPNGGKGWKCIDVIAPDLVESKQDCATLKPPECVERADCEPKWWACEVPDGKTIKEACPDGIKGFNCITIR